MTISLSTLERAAIAAVMHRGHWGGGAAVLLAQARVYRGLELGQFLGKDGAALGRLSRIDRKLYELPDDATEVLSAVLCAGGQSAEIALLNAGVLERLDPVAAVAATVTAVVDAEAPPPPTNGHRRTRKGAV